MNFAERLIEVGKYCLKKSFTFSGRASRSEFFLCLLFCVFCSVLLFIASISVAVPLGYVNEDVALIVAYVLALCPLLLIPPYVSSLVRRFHDVNKSKMFVILLFIPFINLLPFFLLFKPGDAEDNLYGPPPKKF